MANIPIIKLPNQVNVNGAIGNIPANPDNINGHLAHGVIIGQNTYAADPGAQQPDQYTYCDIVNIPKGKDYLIVVYNSNERAASVQADGFTPIGNNLSYRLNRFSLPISGADIPEQYDPCSHQDLSEESYTGVIPINGTFAIFKPSDYFSFDGNGMAVRITYAGWTVSDGRPVETTLPKIFAIDMTDSIQGAC